MDKPIKLMVNSRFLAPLIKRFLASDQRLEADKQPSKTGGLLDQDFKECLAAWWHPLKGGRQISINVCTWL